MNSSYSECFHKGELDSEFSVFLSKTSDMSQLGPSSGIQNCINTEY